MNKKMENNSTEPSKYSQLSNAQKVRSWSVINAAVCGAAVIGLGVALIVKLVQNNKNNTPITVNFAVREEDNTTLVGEKTVHLKANTKFSEFNKPTAVLNKHSFAYWTMTTDDVPVDPDYVVENNVTFYPVMTPGPIELVDGIYAYIYEQGQWGQLKIDDVTGESAPSPTSYMYFTLETDEPGNPTYKIQRNLFDYPVVIGGACAELPKYFLANCQKFNQEIFFPSSVHTVGSGFLYGCTSFTQKLIVPDNIFVIGDSFMEGCTKFNQPLIISYDLISIGNNFLSGCTNFNGKIEFSNIAQDPKLATIGDNFLSGTAYNQPLELPVSITQIGNGFLMDCKFFNQLITIPTKLKNIGTSFLEGCSSFNTALTFGCADLHTIPDDFMKDCKTFNKKLRLDGADITVIGDDFMFGCSNFNQSFFNGNADIDNSFYNLVTIGESFMEGCTAFTGEDSGGKAGLVFTNKVKEFGTCFLYNTNNLKKIEIKFDIASIKKPIATDYTVIGSDASHGAVAVSDGTSEKILATKFVDFYINQTDKSPYRNLTATA